MQLCKLSAPPPRVTDVNGHETRQVDERLNRSLVHVGPGNEVTQTWEPLSRRLLDLDYYYY